MSAVSIERIRIDGGTQTRACLDQDTINDYADAYERGDPMPPVVAFEDGDHLWLSDGFHRIAGARKSGKAEIDADIRQGTQRDALLFAAGCNTMHGLRRTNEDKRLTVSLLLADPEWANCSNRWVAEACKVSDHLVAEVRAELEAASARTRTTNKPLETRTAKNGRQQPARKPSIVCPRCERIGTPVNDCRSCAGLRKRRAAKPPPTRAELLKEAQKHFDKLLQIVDELEPGRETPAGDRIRTAIEVMASDLKKLAYGR
jgi:hypothetical protein